jgi:signal transduction histidine kinase/CheY-like chemotaxis protein
LLDWHDDPTPDVAPWRHRLGHAFDRVVASFRDVEGLASHAALQVRFVVGACLLGIAVALFTAAQAVVDSQPGAAGLIACFGLGLGVVLGLLRTRLEVRALLWGLLGLLTVFFIAAADVTPALHGEQLAWFSLLPLLPLVALLVLGGWSPLVSAALALAGMLLVLWLHAHGFSLGQPEPQSPQLDALIDAATLLASLLGLAFLFDSLRRRAEADARRALKARARFLANVSHELRTPMNGVIGMAELLSYTVLDPAQRRSVDAIHASGETMVALINDLLDLTRVESGRLELEARPFSPADLGAQLEALFAPLAARKGLTFVRVPAPLPEALEGDALRVKQVLTNLLGNALKFTAYGEVRLELTWAEGLLSARVIDQGIGLSDEAQRRLFRPFEQADTSTTRQYGGTGLGLAISHALATRMRGTLTVRSAPGQGSTFELLVPLPETSAPAPDAPQAPPRRLEAGRVLVVEDNLINQAVTRGLLERLGLSCDVVSDGTAALEAVGRTPYALVLMDCQMPVMDGYEATRRIRALEGPAAALPILALTAASLPEDLRRCTEAGMNQVLLKPVSLQALSQALTGALHPFNASPLGQAR